MRRSRGKDVEVRRDEGKEEKGMTADERVVCFFFQAEDGIRDISV